jgi:hypothetical protein
VAPSAPDDSLIACRVVERCRQAANSSADLGPIDVPAGELRAADPDRPRRAEQPYSRELALRRHVAAVRAATARSGDAEGGERSGGERSGDAEGSERSGGGRSGGTGGAAPAYDVHAAAASKFEALPGGTRYSEPVMRPYELERTLAVCAQMKMGKTKTLREYVDRHFAAGLADPVIRFVTFRQTFSRALQEAFPDFTLYSDVPAGTPLSAAAYPRLIVQVESLGRLPPPRPCIVAPSMILSASSASPPTALCTNAESAPTVASVGSPTRRFAPRTRGAGPIAGRTDARERPRRPAWLRATRAMEASRSCGMLDALTSRAPTSMGRESAAPAPLRSLLPL